MCRCRYCVEELWLAKPDEFFSQQFLRRTAVVARPVFGCAVFPHAIIEREVDSRVVPACAFKSAVSMQIFVTPGETAIFQGLLNGAQFEHMTLAGVCTQASVGVGQALQIIVITGGGSGVQGGVCVILDSSHNVAEKHTAWKHPRGAAAESTSLAASCAGVVEPKAVQRAHWRRCCIVQRSNQTFAVVIRMCRELRVSCLNKPQGKNLIQTGALQVALIGVGAVVRHVQFQGTSCRRLVIEPFPAN